MTHVFVWAASLMILLVWTREGGTRERFVLMVFSQTFEHRGIAQSPVPVWYARAGAAAAPSLLPPF